MQLRESGASVDDSCTIDQTLKKHGLGLQTIKSTEFDPSLLNQTMKPVDGVESAEGAVGNKNFINLIETTGEDHEIVYPGPTSVVTLANRVNSPGQQAALEVEKILHDSNLHSVATESDGPAEGKISPRISAQPIILEAFNIKIPAI